MHQMGCTDATWRIRWTDLCSGGDAGYRYRRCSDLFSAPNAVSMASRTAASNARVVVRLIDDGLVAGGRVYVDPAPLHVGLVQSWTRLLSSQSSRTAAILLRSFGP